MQNTRALLPFLLILLSLRGGAPAMRFYETRESPRTLCPSAKSCPSERYRRHSTFFDYTVCGNIYDCSLGQLCCSDSCTSRRFCSSPVTFIDDHVGECPAESEGPCDRSYIYLRPRCRLDTDCFLDSKCCLDPCLGSKVCMQLPIYKSFSIDAFLGNITISTSINHRRVKTTPRTQRFAERKESETHTNKEKRKTDSKCIRRDDQGRKHVDFERGLKREFCDCTNVASSLVGMKIIVYVYVAYAVFTESNHSSFI